MTYLPIRIKFTKIVFYVFVVYLLLFTSMLHAKDIEKRMKEEKKVQTWNKHNTSSKSLEYEQMKDKIEHSENYKNENKVHITNIDPFFVSFDVFNVQFPQN